MAKKRSLVPREDGDGDAFVAPVEDSREDAYFPPEPPEAEPRRSKLRKKLRKKLAGKANAAPMQQERTVTARPRAAVSLEPEKRKLSRQHRSDLEAWKHHDTRQGLLRGYFAGHFEAARKKYGGGHGGVVLGSQAKNLTVCLPVPSLGWEFMTRQDGFPLGIIVQLVATWGTGKSGLVAELLRWFSMQGGGGEYFENETKHSPEWFESIMGSEAYELLALHNCDSIDDWQTRCSAMMDDHKQRMTGTKKNPGPGRSIPLLFAVDSVMGKLSKASKDKIKAEGFGGKGWPVEALAITRWMQAHSGELDGWPFSLILVNHLKQKTDDKGNFLRSTAGGTHLNFQETFEIEMRGVGSKIDTTEFEGFHVELELMKNSLGGKHRRLRTRVLWWEEEDEAGDLKQRTVWDWDWATTKMLLDMLYSKDKRYFSPRIRALLKKIDFHLESVRSGDADNAAWSKSLGMSGPRVALPWHEIGAMIRLDTGLANQLRWALRIHRRPVLAGDYMAQRNDLASAMP